MPTFRITVDTIPQLEAAVNGLALIGLADMRADPGKYPALYQSGFRYRREPPGSEIWQPVSQVAQSRSGDCEDLAAYRVAELRKAGERATARVIRVNPELRHVMVVRADGRLEDPSRVLGMQGAG
jgi:hypothetical protein